MRIIHQHGTQLQYTAHCTTCNCVFTFNEVDAVHAQGIKMVKCPECSHKIIYKDDDRDYSNPIT